jgi:hypothetical protein
VGRRRPACSSLAPNVRRRRTPACAPSRARRARHRRARSGARAHRGRDRRRRPCELLVRPRRSVDLHEEHGTGVHGNRCDTRLDGPTMSWSIIERRGTCRRHDAHQSRSPPRQARPPGPSYDSGVARVERGVTMPNVPQIRPRRR